VSIRTRCFGEFISTYAYIPNDCFSRRARLLTTPAHFIPLRVQVVKILKVLPNRLSEDAAVWKMACLIDDLIQRPLYSLAVRLGNPDIGYGR
jgi:hypothetical protein